MNKWLLRGFIIAAIPVAIFLLYRLVQMVIFLVTQ